MFKTYQTKMKNEIIVLPNGNSIPVYEYFKQFADAFGMIERKLFVDLYIRNKPSNQLKTSYCSYYQITSRQYNSVKNQLDGRVAAKKEWTLLYMEEIKAKIEKTNAILEKKREQKEKSHQKLLRMKGNEATFPKAVLSYRKLRQYIHQKKRKLYALETKLHRLEEDIANKKIRLCFGSKKLFGKQFHLEENRLTFQEWKSQWKRARSSQFTFLGSKDETYGNQSCTYDTHNNLRIRIHKKGEDFFGTHIIIPNVTFAYGQENIDVAKVPSVGYTKGGNKATYYRALTCKFMFRKDSWYLYISVDVDDTPIQTLSQNGFIGVDFNAGFLAVTEVDRHGNYLHSFQVPYRNEHVTSEQAEQSLSSALKIVVDDALEKQKPIVYEKLNFKAKKKQLSEMSRKQAKMLSGFAYSTYKKLLASKCLRYGVEHIAVNPAYTSQIGHHKYMKKYGLSSHESAAMVIARKGLLGKKVEKVPMNHFLQSKPQKKKRMDQWKELCKQWKSYTFGQKNYLLYRMF